MTHVALPLLATMTLVALYFTPIGLVGCANRGFAALAVALAALVTAVVTAGKACRASRRSDPSAGWWLASTVLLLLPVALLIWPLG
jgi:hypothetical protein